MSPLIKSYREAIDKAEANSGEREARFVYGELMMRADAVSRELGRKGPKLDAPSLSAEDALKPFTKTRHKALLSAHRKLLKEAAAVDSTPQG